MTRLTLIPTSGSAPGTESCFEVDAALAVVLGRDSSCDVRVDEAYDVVSRRHVTIRWDGQALVAHDSSSNGLFVNGQRVAKSQVIDDEDMIQLGHNGPVFTVTLDPKPVKAPPPSKETRTLAPTRPPQPVIEVATAPSPEPTPTTSASADTHSAQDALQDMARSGKQLLSGAAASIRRAVDEHASKDSPAGEAMQDIARGGKKLFSSAAASVKRSTEKQADEHSARQLNRVHQSSSHGGFFMLSRFIVRVYHVIIEILLWLFMLTAVSYGWKYNGMLGALGAAFGASLFGALVFGAFLVLSDIRLSVRRIEDRLHSKD